MELINKSVVEIHHNEFHPEIEPVFKHSIKEEINTDLLTILNKYKRSIDGIQNIKKWDFYKKMSNPFELVNQYIKTKNLNLGLANYNPISRAFFKFWEIWFDFDLIDRENNSINFAALAEGPGGFIDAFDFYRKKYSVRSDDTINCITLKSNDNDNSIPDWKRIFGCRYNVSWGEDNTGNLYHLPNIKHFGKLFSKKKADLVTADGGFDFSTDYVHQEVNITQLILCEVVTGLSILKDGGHMVVKIFDIFQRATIETIYLLSLYFSKVYIVKPFTSRPANNEKYLVCKGFLGINDIILEKLFQMIDKLNEHSDQFLDSFLGVDIPEDFQKIIESYNYHSVVHQLKFIIKTNIYIKEPLFNEDYNDIKKQQCIQSIAWCIKYDYDINKKCKYLDSKNRYNYIPNF